MTAPRTRLACPRCGALRLHSDEVASILYPVRLYRDAAGEVVPDYTGDSYEVMDEGTVYRGVIWCRACGAELTEADLADTRPGTERGQTSPRGTTPHHTAQDAEAPESGPSVH